MQVVTVLLASGVGARFGATNDALRYVNYVRWEDNSRKDDLIDYYNKAIVPVVFLLLGTVLSMAATVVSARLRARATDEADARRLRHLSPARSKPRSSMPSGPSQLSLCFQFPYQHSIHSACAWGISEFRPIMHGSDPVDLALLG